MLAPHPHPAPFFPQTHDDPPFRVETFTAQRALEQRARAIGQMALEVARGLARSDKRLPTWLLRDAEGVRLSEEITHLPAYYASRAENEILRERADDIVAVACHGHRRHLEVVELNAGTATKTQHLLDAAVRARCVVDYLPVDVSRESLEVARSRLAAESPRVLVRPLAMQPTEGLAAIRQRGPERMVVLLGSTLGSHEDAEAVELLRSVRASVRAGEVLLVGTDIPKPSSRVLAAHDDVQGVTARYHRGVLRRINDELGGHFALPRFRHVVLWNEARSRVETYLESTVAQSVVIDALGMTVSLRAGERIHVESLHTYDDAHADRLLAAGGFTPVSAWRDRERLFAVRLARAS